MQDGNAAPAPGTCILPRPPAPAPPTGAAPTAPGMSMPGSVPGFAPPGVAPMMGMPGVPPPPMALPPHGMGGMMPAGMMPPGLQGMMGGVPGMVVPPLFGGTGVQMSGQPPPPPGAPPPGMLRPPASVMQVALDCPKDVVGKVIGKGGETIKDLQARSGCSVQIDQSMADNLPRKINISGPLDKLENARQMVESAMGMASPSPPTAQLLAHMFPGGAIQAAAVLGTTAIVAPPAAPALPIDPDVQEFCDHFSLDARMTKLLNEELHKRPDTWEGDLLALWEIIETARVPAGLLMVKIREMQAGTFVGKPKPDKDVVDLSKAYKLDDSATQRLSEVMAKRQDKTEVMEKLRKHLSVSNKPSAVVMMLLGKLRKGEDIGEPEHKAAAGSLAWEKEVKSQLGTGGRDRRVDREHRPGERVDRDRWRDKGRDRRDDRGRRDGSRSRRKSPSRPRRDRSRSRGRGRRDRSRSRRDSRKRSRSRSRKKSRSRSRKRSSSRRRKKSRSRSRSGKKSRSRSRSGKSKSRSRSRKRKKSPSRKRSRSRSRKKSRSRSRKKSRSRSRKKDRSRSGSRKKSNSRSRSRSGSKEKEKEKEEEKEQEQEKEEEKDEDKENDNDDERVMSENEHDKSESKPMSNAHGSAEQTLAGVAETRPGGQQDAVPNGENPSVSPPVAAGVPVGATGLTAALAPNQEAQQPCAQSQLQQLAPQPQMQPQAPPPVQQWHQQTPQQSPVQPQMQQWQQQWQQQPQMHHFAQQPQLPQFCQSPQMQQPGQQGHMQQWQQLQPQQQQQVWPTG